MANAARRSSIGDHSVPLGAVDPENDRFPCCIVWSPIPLITWLMPFIGHMGIADTDGITYDFAGPYHISVAHMSFGSTTRYLQLDPSKCFNEDWNTAVNRACDVYRERMHQICCDNCHSHVAVALEAMHYRGRERWDMATLAVWMFFRGTYVDATAVLKQWAPFFAVVIVLSFVVHL